MAVAEIHRTSPKSVLDVMIEEQEAEQRAHIEDEMRTQAKPSCTCCGREMKSGRFSLCYDCAF